MLGREEIKKKNPTNFKVAQTRCVSSNRIPPAVITPLYKMVFVTDASPPHELVSAKKQISVVPETAKYEAKYVAMGHDKEGEEQELKRLIPLVAIRFSEELQRNSKRRPEETN